MTWRVEVWCAAGLIAGVAVGRATAPEEVRTVERQTFVHDHVDQARTTQRTKQQGPRIVTRVVTRDVPGPAGPEHIVERTRVVEGPVTTIVRDAEQKSVTHELDQSSRVTNAARPMWSLALGAQLSPTTSPTVTLGVRVVGPLWLEAWARPQFALALPAAGAGVRMEW